MAVVIFKPLEKCNSNCLYCGVVQKKQDLVMDYDLLEIVFNRMNEYLEANPGEKITLTWHGGEPCLLGPEYFRKALDFQDRHCKETKDRIVHIIQSNLTIITQELIDLFKEMGIHTIGTSFEPLPNIRGPGKDRDSDVYNRLFFQGVDLVEKNGLGWGCIYVVHRRSLGRAREIFYYLTNMNLKSQPTFNKIYLYSGDEHNLNITPEEYADFLGELVPLYWENRIRYAQLKPISTFIEAIERGNNMVCDYSGRCAHHWMYIGPDGKASHCGRSGDFAFIDYGNIRDRTIHDILYDKKRDPIEERQLFLPENECKDCRFWGICHGGCPLDAYTAHGSFMKPTMNCSGIKRLLENYIEPVTGMEVNLPPPDTNS